MKLVYSLMHLKIMNLFTNDCIECTKKLFGILFIIQKINLDMLTIGMKICNNYMSIVMTCHIIYNTIFLFVS